VFVAFGIQHAMRMLHVILSPVACPALQRFSALSHKRHDIRKRVIEHKMWGFSMRSVMVFSTILVRNISHSKEN
jgi:hypothetical protein